MEPRRMICELFAPSKWRPSHWTSLYFASIVLFAVIYWANPNGFYHSTSSLEPSTQSTRVLLGAAIQQALEERASEEGLKNWSVSVNIMEQIESAPRMMLIFGGSNPQAMHARFAVRGIQVRDPNSKRHGKNSQVLIYPDEDASPDILLVPPSSTTLEEFITTRRGVIDVFVEQKTISLFDEWSQAAHGKGGTTEGRFVRMLYFSTVTATTLGYGDIVPLNNWMRFAISVQSILGLLLIGGLLNALLKGRN